MFESMVSSMSSPMDLAQNYLKIDEKRSGVDDPVEKLAEVSQFY